MKNKKEELLHWFAFNSFSIVRYLLGTLFLFICLIYIFKSCVSIVWLYMLFLIGGVFAGYCFAYYSIKYLHDKQIGDSNK